VSREIDPLGPVASLARTPHPARDARPASDDARSEES